MNSVRKKKGSLLAAALFREKIKDLETEKRVANQEGLGTRSLNKVTAKYEMDLAVRSTESEAMINNYEKEIKKIVHIAGIAKGVKTKSSNSER